MARTYQGACFCGAVRIEVDGPPAMQGYCHCVDCRGWSGAPVTGYALWPAGKVRVVEGDGKLTRFNKSGTGLRCSCSVCGGAVMSELIGADLIDVYPPLLEGFTFKPKDHVRYAQRVIDIPDGLPKFRDLPETAGGSGELIDG